MGAPVKGRAFSGYHWPSSQTELVSDVTVNADWGAVLGRRVDWRSLALNSLYNLSYTVHACILPFAIPAIHDPCNLHSATRTMPLALDT
jgi:hypothetical protein